MIYLAFFAGLCVGVIFAVVIVVALFKGAASMGVGAGLNW